jgi:hypothetical protein
MRVHYDTHDCCRRSRHGLDEAKLIEVLRRTHNCRIIIKCVSIFPLPLLVYSLAFILSIFCPVCKQ